MILKPFSQFSRIKGNAAAMFFGPKMGYPGFKKGCGSTKRMILEVYLLIISHSHGKWPIEIDDFPSYKLPFSSGILHGYVSHNQRV